MFYEIHSHCMRFEDYPIRFPNVVIGRLQGSKFGFNILDFVLSNVNPFSNNDTADRIISMAKAGRLGSQKAIYMDGRSCYPSDTQIVCLTMDMNYMGASVTRRQYIQQLYELDKICQEDNRVLPFFHADPRRGNLQSLFEEFVIKRNWPGVKIYAHDGNRGLCT